MNVVFPFIHSKTKPRKPHMVLTVFSTKQPYVRRKVVTKRVIIFVKVSLFFDRLQKLVNEKRSLSVSLECAATSSASDRIFER